jgi:drug/metabolite transporter (DMT)-like permease
MRRLSANGQGILWMVAAMAAFSLEDAFIKRVTLAWPIAQVLVAFGLAGALVFGVAARLGRTKLLVSAVWSKPMRWRAVFELIGRLFYVLAVALTPLSSATVILQATPVLVVLAGSLIFKEQVGWRRWVAVLAGLLGVLIILRPGADAFSPLSLLTIAGMVGFAGRDLASRAAPPELGTVHLGFFGMLTVVLAGALYALWSGQAWVWPDGGVSLVLLAAVLVGTLAYAALMRAMRTGDIATVTPFRYSRLLFGVGLGVGVFGERLDAGIVLGSLVIASAGVLIAWDARQRRR